MKIVPFGKGAGLGADDLGLDGVLFDELARLGVPVLPGFTVAAGTQVDDDALREALAGLEAETGQRLGDADNPLLLAVRASAARIVPGVAAPVLDVGLTSGALSGLMRQAGCDERYAHEVRRRLIQALGRTALGIPGDRFEDAAYGLDDPAAVVDAFLGFVDFPDDPVAQVRLAVEGVLSTWSSPRAVRARRAAGAPDDLGVAVHVQTMAHGPEATSGAGRVLSRNPATGEPGITGAFGAGEGRETPTAGAPAPGGLDLLSERFPQAAEALTSAVAVLERHHGDLCEVEFAVADGRLWVLHSAPARERGAEATVRIAVELAEEGCIDREEALRRVRPAEVERLLHPRFAPGAATTLLTTGLGASPGAACGHVALTADDAEALAAAGRPVILVRPETAPDDLHGMLAASGILTARGGLASHAAVVARGMGRPAVCGATEVEVDTEAGCLRIGATTVAAGDVIGIDGTTGAVVLGDVPVEAPRPSGALDTLLSWADDVRRLGVRANADTGEDAAVARRFGAEGIGLCRTEHQFLGDRLPLVQRMILARTPEEEQAALAGLAEVQRSDFVALLEAMDGLPVTVRLLDPPLHEFLPDLEELAVADARGELDDAGRELLRTARAWHESNPMLGTRGVRLAVLKPWLYPMQARALFEAAAERVAAGGRPIVEVMIPLVVAPAELATVAASIRAVADEVGTDGVEWRLGTMIETPRAALAAGAVAAEAEFFSFGTNDLTQLTFGFSRDDVESRVIPTYLEQRLLPANPFETLDEEVARLVGWAVEAGRAARPALKVGICGEHGGDAASIARCAGLGLDYVSCSPYRVPVARLAAARAALGAD